jgi:hypothetical protein
VRILLHAGAKVVSNTGLARWMLPPLFENPGGAVGLSAVPRCVAGI